MNKKMKECINNLQHLLEKQIEAVRKSNFQDFENLALQADLIITEIADIKPSDKKQFTGYHEHLAKSYQKLELMLLASKDSLAKQLRQVAEGKKTIQTYQNSGQF